MQAAGYRNLRCPGGTIKRVGYRTKTNATVRPTCTRDVGRPGKGVPVWRLQRGSLKPYKIVNPNSNTGAFYQAPMRHRLLREAYDRTRQPRKQLLLKRLNALRNYFSNYVNQPRRERMHRAISADIVWVQANMH